MQYLKLKFICEIKNSGYFSMYGGSMLRGVLGNNLRHSFCVTHKDDCPSCILAKNCVFPRLFAAALAPEGHSTTTLTPPFCIEPPLNVQHEYRPGEHFSFNLKLFSFATEYLPYFVHSFTLAGRHGMGRGSRNGSGQYEIIDILCHDQSIYNAAEEKLEPYEPDILPLPELNLQTEPYSVEMTFLTPLRFKNINQLSHSLDFYQLFRLILRRIKNLWALDEKLYTLSPEDFDQIKDLAQRITVSENSLTWHDWSRYSSRQNTTMKLGGLTGAMIYNGPVAAFKEYLDFASKVHIGKQTTFGLGACSCRWLAK